MLSRLVVLLTCLFAITCPAPCLAEESATNDIGSGNHKRNNLRRVQGNSNGYGSAKDNGIGRPWDPANLPPGLQKKLNDFPAEIQAKILVAFEASNLNTKMDGDYIDIDDNGDILFIDPPPPIEDLDEFPIPDGDTHQYPANVPVQSSGVPSYHSKPGASYTLYLDFDGHVFSGHVWANGALIDAKPYDTDGNPNSYSGSELAVIGKSWAVVAEDFAPFDVDVTTEEPENLDNSVGHVLMTDEVSRNGVTIYDCGCGGVAYLNVFNRANYASYYSPALVFNKSFRGVSEAISHEFGHNLGLSHDAAIGVGYYSGHNDWAPIMGVGYYETTVQWSKGEYEDATQTQDDLAIIANNLGYAQDDHTVDTPLVITGTQGYAEGLIERNTDQDTFTFSGGGDPVSIVVRSRDSFYGNLDVGFRLINSETPGETLATVVPESSKDATWTGTLAFGNYNIVVYGTGKGANAAVGYTAYGSLGQYEVTVTGLSTQGSPTNAPTPLPSPASITPTPTLPPTNTPTSVPTWPPTNMPTTTPSVVPTITPTATSTVTPTATPTSSPTPQPTATPITPPPSLSPTPMPSPAPVTPSPIVAAVCGDGVCDSNNGETCDSCVEDCGSIMNGATCGNGICEAGNGETCNSCPVDCNGISSGNPAQRFCCGDDSMSSCTNDVRCGTCTFDFQPDVTYCPTPEVCDDGIDNDGNGFVDCVDTACANDPACAGNGGCVASGGASGSCYINPSQCCSGQCHKKFDRCQ